MTDLELYEDEEEVEQSLSPAEIQQANDAEIRKQTERISRLGAELAELATAVPDEQALVTQDASPAGKKRELGVLRVEAVRQQEMIQQKRDEIKKASDEMARTISKQMQLAQEMLAPLEKYVKRLEEGIWMVNLYLGRDEEIVALREGEPAGPEVPVSIRQLVLYMDEECAINAEGGGITGVDLDIFDAWLQADPRNVNQVIPEQKGVVALKPRRRSKRYENAWEQAGMEKADSQTYFLIRNGDKLWRTWTEFDVGERLVPLASEFAEYFYEKRTSHSRGRLRDHRIRIEPGTLAWERAEEAADDRQRHYMRVGLILQGLVDRTTVFHPLPETGVNFLDHEHGGKSWRFVIDAEGLLETGRLPFREWLEAKNRELRVGMRIIGTFNKWEDRNEKYAVSPRGAEKPPTGELLRLEEKGTESGSFIVRYKRTEKIWKRWDQVEAQRRASCVISANDENIIPYDLVDEEEMQVYLNARLDRHAYADMFPILKAAIKAKREEREQEAPFRTMLVGVIARDNGVEAEQAEEVVDELITWWKLRNKYHRPLVGDEMSQAKAVRMIVAEDKLRRKSRGTNEQTANVIKEHLAGKPLLAIAQRRAGGYVGIVESRHELFENVDYQSPYVDLYEFTARGAPKEVAKAWRLLTPTIMSSLTVVWQSEKFESWDKHASAKDHLTGPELAHLAERVIASSDDTIAVAYDPTGKRKQFYIWEFGDDPVLQEEPFTGERKKPVSNERGRSWSRKGTAAPVLREHAWSSARPNYSYQTKPWDTRPRKNRGRMDQTLWWDDEQVEDEEMQQNKYIVLFHDPKLEQRYLDGKKLYDEAVDVADAARQRVHAYLKSIATQWEARNEQQIQQRFLEDYLDIGLWEGHKKTLKSSVFEYPHSHYRTWQHEPDALALMVEYHVEKDMPLDGVSVWDASKNFPPTSWIKKSMGDDWRWRHKDPPKPDDIPEDIRDLVFREPPVEPEDDGED